MSALQLLELVERARRDAFALRTLVEVILAVVAGARGDGD